MTYPGVYVDEIPSDRHTIVGVATSITAFVGRAHQGPLNEPITLFSFGDFEREFGEVGYEYPMSYAVADFFLNGGSEALVVRIAGRDGGPLDALTLIGNEDQKTGLYSLKKADLFNLLCIPPDQRAGDTDPAVYSAAVSFCKERRAMLIVDPPMKWGEHASKGEWAQIQATDPALGVTGEYGRNAAVYFPRIVKTSSWGRAIDPNNNTSTPLLGGYQLRNDSRRPSTILSTT